MATKEITYPANGKIDDLNQTCQSDEGTFRGRLIKLNQIEDDEGATGVKATYERIPMTQPFTVKKLSFRDITKATADEQRDIAEEEMAQGRAEAFRAEVFLEDKPATIVVYRKA